MLRPLRGQPLFTAVVDGGIVSGNSKMMSVEMRGGVGGGMVGGGVDPSNLHLKKELTQIRKAARVLKDPGTSSSWRSPLASATSLTNNHNVNGQIDEKDRTVFLYNWKNQKSESERSRQNDKDDGSSDVDSFTSASTGVGENDSRGDSCLSNRYGSAIFKCKDSNFTPSIRHSIKKKSKRSNHSSTSSRHKKEKLQMQMLLSRYKKNAVDGLAGSSLGGDDLLSLVDQSDDTEDYCNSEDLAKTSALSLLLLKLKNNGWAHSSDKKRMIQFHIVHQHCRQAFITDTPLRIQVQLILGMPPLHRLTMLLMRHQCSSLGSNKRRLSSKTAAQILVPLLKNSADDRGSSMGSGKSDDELSTISESLIWRCQKHIFNKISDGDIVTRLRKISTDERLDVESNALELIALNADGSLRDAETMLEQLSLFGKRITKSLVNELIGVVSDDKLLDLLELAMSSNATETVIRARELMDSGVDSIILMSQLVTLIVDIIAERAQVLMLRTVILSLVGEVVMTERELDRLKHALTLLSEAEKHLRVSSERSTWFTATLLQLGSLSFPDQKTLSTSSRRQSSNTTEEDHISMHKEATPQKQRNDAQFVPEKAAFSNSTSKEKPVSLTDADFLDSKNYQSRFIDGENLTVPNDDCKSGGTTLTCTESKMLIDIWLKCIEKCHSKTLRQLLHSYGKLVSISEMKDQLCKGGFVAHVAFENHNIKTRAEGFLSSITNSFEIVLRCNVEVKLIVLQDSPDQKLRNENLENKSTRSNITGGNSDLDLRQDPPKVSKGSFNVSEDQQMQPSESITRNDSNSEVPLRRIESIIREQRLEAAWLKAMDKNTPGSTSLLKPEKNQVLPQDGIDHPNELESMKSVDVPLHNWEDEANHEIKALKINDGMTNQKGQIVKRTDRCPISPSLLHNSSSVSNFSKDNILGDMNLDQEQGVAVGCSVGVTASRLTEEERLNKAFLHVHVKVDGFLGLENVQNQDRQTTDTVDDRKGKF
ncbi:hypothetical protein DH2020_026742 [Rehmannia glutinosa]|uniref:Uncharacterized protein n=1 Tax=Rehmannia glutinosa TaxID=99300 RepID=A0ABR0VZ10_REHGL